MENVVPFKIQLLSIVGTVLFMAFIVRLIVRGRLRAEYAIIWALCALVLVVFSVWRNGLEQLSLKLGVFYPPSLLFLLAIGAMVCFLVHLSVVSSTLQRQIKDLAQEVAFLRHELTQQPAETNRPEGPVTPVGPS